MNTQNHVLAITLMLAAGTAIAAPAPARQTADSIWSGGAILTMNDKAMRAEAVAVANGKIIAVGSRKEVMKLKGPGTQLVDRRREREPDVVVEAVVDRRRAAGEHRHSCSGGSSGEVVAVATVG